ncbi:hypothetical protein TNCV_1171361 [Trichonephila clavipes]|nr:hypothetical protein TNCV_1171361 [Trichonephila clavipes]
MDFPEINSRGKRGELLGRIDRRNSRFGTAKTIIIKFGLHASFVELESAKNAVNEKASDKPATPPSRPDEDMRLNERDCEESEESADVIDNILVNPDIFATRDGKVWILHNTNLPGRFATRNVWRQIPVFISAKVMAFFGFFVQFRFEALALTCRLKIKSQSGRVATYHASTPQVWVVFPSWNNIPQLQFTCYSDLLRNRTPVVNRFVEWPAKHASKPLGAAKSGKYGGWFNTQTLFFAKNRRTTKGCLTDRIVVQQTTAFISIFWTNTINSGHETL